MPYLAKTSGNTAQSTKSADIASFISDTTNAGQKRFHSRLTES
jgi:hypothetical protein